MTTATSARRALLRLAAIGAVALCGCGKQQPPPPAAPTPEEQAAAMAQMHEHDAPVASPAALVKVPPQAVEGQAVTYGSLDGKSLQGYFVKPKGAAAGLPGVIVFHEWWGLNDNIRSMADQLASRGYAVLAADMYGGRSATTPDVAQGLMRTALSNTPALDKNIAAAFGYLKDTAGAPKVATLGWCFGGSMSFEAGQVLSGKLAATVIYYGFVNDKPDQLAKLKAPVLGLFGAQDPGIPVATVNAFEKGLEADGDLPIVKVYPDAGHAFANPSGTGYRKDDADDAWKRTLDFLGENLKT